MELVRHRLERLVEEAAAKARENGAIPPVSIPPVVVERPQNAEHGDYATSLPLKLARSARMNPLAIAEKLAKALPSSQEIQSAQAAPPGFINFVLKDDWLQQQVEAIRSEGESFGNVDVGKKQRVLLEFVSVNPTGPVHVGHGRGAVLGSTLANALQAAGFDVTREYYINDAGNQIDTFYRSLYARCAEHLGLIVEMPSDGYMGDYMKDLAREIWGETQDKRGLEELVRSNPQDATQRLGRVGLEKMLGAIKVDLEALRVEFDVWFREQTLFNGGQYEKALELLKGGGYLAEREGALWFASTALGDDKDNVLVRSTGAPTYFASDIAYHYNKLVERGFDRAINIWGADHQGHVPRMKAAATALGIDPARLQVIISQLVTLRRGEQVLRISKRTGDIITLREVVDEVGPDACRFFLLSRSADSQMDFDLELAKQQSQENPVYYVQYAHARIASILRLAAERQIDYKDGDVALLADPSELALVRKMLLLPELVESIAYNLEPHHLPHYAQDLATDFHWFYKQCRVVSEDNAMTAARLKLVEAAQITLARTLHLMGMSAPERM